MIRPWPDDPAHCCRSSRFWRSLQFVFRQLVAPTSAKIGARIPTNRSRYLKQF